MLPTDLQHEQFLMFQARALGVDWRPAAGFVREALLACADLALADPLAAGRAARALTRLEPLAWAHTGDEAAPRLALLCYAPERALDAGQREPLERARAAFEAAFEAGGEWSLEAYAIGDDGEVAPLGPAPTG